MARRAKDHCACVRLVVAGAVVLAILAGGIGQGRIEAASQGCSIVNGLSPFRASDYTIPSLLWDAGEEVTFTAGASVSGNPSAIQLFVNGTLAGDGPVPGAVSYTMLSTGQGPDLRLLTDQGEVMLTVTCTVPPTVTPTNTQTNSPTSPPTLTLSTTPTGTSTATAIATLSSTATPTTASTSTATKTPTATATPIPGVAINPNRGTVNINVQFSLTGFPHNAPVKISWLRMSGSIYDFPGPYFTNSNGSLAGTFKVPATTGGLGQQITFKSGNVSRTVLFEVAPRIKVNTNPAVRGQFADVSLRGYAKNETVRIRWKKGSSWVTLATVVTSNTGSANVEVKVPTFAPNGLNSVRGDGTVFRQQTNAVNVQGGPAATGVSMATAGQPSSRPPLELMSLAIPAISLGFVARRRPRKRASF